MRTFTKEWLKAAKDDLTTIEEIIANESLTNIVAFHSQQCIEKVFKALIEENELDIPKIHKLLKLSKIIPYDMEILSDDMLGRLDHLYIDSRYPGDIGLLSYGKPTLDDAEKFHKFAKDVFLKACKVLNISETNI